MGAAHRLVEAFLDPKFHLPKNTVGRPGKKSFEDISEAKFSTPENTAETVEAMNGNIQSEIVVEELLAGPHNSSEQGIPSEFFENSAPGCAEEEDDQMDYSKPVKDRSVGSYCAFSVCDAVLADVSESAAAGNIRDSTLLEEKEKTFAGNASDIGRPGGEDSKDCAPLKLTIPYVKAEHDDNVDESPDECQFPPEQGPPSQAKTHQNLECGDNFIEQEDDLNDSSKPDSLLEFPFPYIKSEPFDNFPKEMTFDEFQADQFVPQQGIFSRVKTPDDLSIDSSGISNKSNGKDRSTSNPVVATVNNDHFSKTAEPEMPSEPHNKENCSVWLPTAPSESFDAYHVKDQNIAGRDILTDANREHGSSVMGSISEQRSTIPSTEYSCSKCGKKLKHACHLYSHYSIDHFRKEILAECAGFFKKVCPICGTSKACNTESKLAIHLGIRHRMVDLFLEPQFQVPRYFKHRKKYFEVRETVRENISARSIHGPLIEKEKEKTDKERPGAVDFEDNAP
jgi:hypothetical protein